MTGTLADPRVRPARVPPRHRARRVLPEAAGLAAAVTFALIAVAHLVLTDRAWVLFSDGDSVLPALLHGSLAVGERQDWALSSVLFVPEFALYSALAALGLGVRGTLAVNAVVNLVLFYAAVRAVTGLVRPRATRATRIAAAVLAAGAFDARTLLDSSAAWDSLELPSLLATTTYYSATVLAAVAAVGLTAALFARRRRATAVGLLALTAVSTWTNPLFVAWAVLPLALIAAGLTVRRSVAPRVTASVLGVLAAGVAAGFAARLPFASLIARGPAAYAHPDGALPAVGYTLRLVVERCATGAGIASLLAAVALQAAAAVVALRLRRSGSTAGAAVAAYGVVAPVAAVLGSIALGAPASRYLQPVFFAPILVLTLVKPPARLPAPLRSRAARVTVALLGAAAALASAAAIGSVAARADPGIRCVDAWVTASGRTGAGLFQTIRGPKAYLPDPRRLVQVDATLHAQPWLTDRADYDVARVSFLVTDTASPAIAVPPSAPVPAVVRCGRYRILDYGAAVLPILPAGPLVPPTPPPTAAFH